MALAWIIFLPGILEESSSVELYTYARASGSLDIACCVGAHAYVKPDEVPAKSRSRVSKNGPDFVGDWHRINRIRDPLNALLS